MATQRGPKIVQNGLIICLDAADRAKSYTGSGNSWRNLGSQATNGVLNNTPTWYPNEKGGSFFFDTFSTGSMDTEGVTLTTRPALTSAFTMEMFVNLASPAKNGTLYAGWLCGVESVYRLTYGSGFVGIAVATTGNGWPGQTAVHSFSPYGVWNQIVGLYDGTYNRIYVNGVLAVTSAATSGNLVDNGNPFYWFWTGAGVVEGGRGYGSILRIYNRGLTAAEVRQNFNAQRGRFGI
jgi:hypothetical protein